MVASQNPNVQQADLSGETRRLEKWVVAVGLFALALLVAGFVTGEYQPLAVLGALVFLVAISWLWSVAVDRMFHRVRQWSKSHTPQPVARPAGSPKASPAARALREVTAGRSALSLGTLVESGAVPPVRLSATSSDASERVAALKMEASERLRELASQLEAQGKAEEAAEVLRSADGASDVARDEMSEALQLARDGDYEQAAAALECVVRTQPSGAAWYTLGVCQGMTGQTAEAAQSLHRAADAGADSAALRLALGGAYAELGQHDRAEKQLTAAVAMDEGLAAAHGALGEVQLAQGKAQNAASHLDEALSLAPGLALARAARGRLHYQKGNNAEAVRDLAEAVKADPDNRDLAFNYTAALAAAGRSDEVISFARPIVDEHPDAEMAQLVAEALEKKGRTEDARAYLALTAELAPESDSARVKLARSLRLEGRVDEAISEAEAAVGDNPRSAEALLELGLALEASGDSDGALRRFQSAVQMDRSSSAALTQLGRVMLASGQVKEAARMLKQATGLAGASADAFYWLGEAHLGMEKPLLAMESLREALGRSPDRRGDVSYAYGRAMLGAGRAKEAAEELRRARKLLPDAPEVERDLGYALHRLRNYQDAARSLRAYLAASPDAADAGEVRALVEKLSAG